MSLAFLAKLKELQARIDVLTATIAVLTGRIAELDAKITPAEKRGPGRPPKERDAGH